MIYFVQAGEGGPIKIGFTSSWGLRLSVLQTGNHEELLVKALMQGDRGDEEKLHERFASARIRGEWFEATDELKELCREVGMAALDAAGVPENGLVKRTVMLRQDQIERIKADAAAHGREFSAHLRIVVDDWFGPPRKPNRGDRE